ncbi:unnamed protein product [Onchocerca flexuosa]|uniref:Phage protein n=1 Tax=Onchocerca flexuosa TaxID=387005 RepID=A0A183HC84_9BILA|nr:unnamed protein product [Onchocerca flexuosa]
MNTQNTLLFSSYFNWGNLFRYASNMNDEWFWKFQHKLAERSPSFEDDELTRILKWTSEITYNDYVMR